MTRRWFAVWAISVAPFCARAADYYVDAAGGNDAWSGLCAAWDGAACGPKLTIAAAMAAAQDGDTVIILPGVYRGDGNRDLDFGGKALAVRGEDAEDPAVVAQTVIDCEGSAALPHRAFKFVNGERSDSILAGLTIQNGVAPKHAFSTLGEAPAGGGVLCASSGPTIFNCIIRDCRANYGGAVAADRPIELTLIGCTLLNNTACQQCAGSSPYIPEGGGLAALAGEVRFIDCTVEANEIASDASIGRGAGLHAGGASNAPVARFELIRCMLADNRILATGNGTTSFHSAGAGIAVDGGILVVRDSRIIANRIPLTLFRGSGGGVYFAGYTGIDLVLERTTFDGNQALNGGGIWASLSQYNIADCVFRRNIAPVAPAINVDRVTRYSDWKRCTVAGHADADGPSCIIKGSPRIRNSVFWNDAAQEILTSGTPVVEYSDIKGGYTGTGNIDVDPLFVDAANGDYHLAPGSPCINAGDPAAGGAGQTDIDGQARVWGGRIDMGADEAGSFPFGDLNCDGTVNTFDINGFIQALIDPAQYAIDHATCDVTLADANFNGSVNQLDIQAFITLLGG